MHHYKKVLSIVLLFLFVTLPAPVTAAAKTKMIPADFAAIAEKAKPAVVNIRTTREVQGGGRVFRHFFGGPFGDRDFFDNFMEPFFRNRPDREYKQQSLGSGFVINKDGYIVTNTHVIQNADKIQVKLYNEKEYDAQVIGTDPKTDLALIKIDAENLIPLKLGSSEDLKIGTWVLAIGSPFGLEQTVTAGIVSAKGRVIGAGPYDDFIQTDASINPGNSGGPLLNLKGEVIGINTAIVRSGQGIGFAIPSDLAQGIVNQLIDTGEVSRGWLGVGIQDVSEELAEYYDLETDTGVLVAEIYKDHPADKAGIKEGDIITAIDGEKIESTRDLSATIASHAVGKEVSVTLIRNGEEKTLQVTLGKRSEMEPESMMAETGYDAFGFQLKEITPSIAREYGIRNDKGLLVTDIKPESQAARTGIEEGDILKEVNHQRVEGLKDYSAIVQKADKGDNLRFLFVRNNSFYLAVTLKKQ